MIQSNTLQSSSASLPSSLFGIGELDATDTNEETGFMTALGEQLKTALVDMGEDPENVATLDAQALLAQFLTHMQTPAIPDTVQPELSADVLPVMTTALPAPETPADLLKRLLESSSAGTGLDLDSGVSLASDFLDPLVAVNTPTAQTAVTADASAQTSPSLSAAMVQQLLQSIPAGAMNAPTAQTDVTAEASAQTSLPPSLSAAMVQQLLQSIPAGAMNAPTAQTAVTADASTQTPSLSAAMVQQWLRSFHDVGAETTGSLSALGGSDEVRTLVKDFSTKPETPLPGMSATDSLSASPQNALRPTPTLDLAQLLRPGGDNPLTEQMKWMMQAGIGTAELKLHPQSLGTMDVRMTLDADKISVQFLSPHPAVRDVLEAALPRLRDSLAQDGLSLGNVSISDQASERRHDPGAGMDRRRFDGRLDDDPDSIEVLEPPRSTLSALAGRLDYFI